MLDDSFSRLGLKGPGFDGILEALKEDLFGFGGREPLEVWARIIDGQIVSWAQDGIRYGGDNNWHKFREVLDDDK